MNAIEELGEISETSGLAEWYRDEAVRMLGAAREAWDAGDVERACNTESTAYMLELRATAEQADHDAWRSQALKWRERRMVRLLASGLIIAGRRVKGNL